MSITDCVWILLLVGLSLSGCKQPSQSAPTTQRAVAQAATTVSGATSLGFNTTTSSQTDDGQRTMAIKDFANTRFR